VYFGTPIVPLRSAAGKNFSLPFRFLLIKMADRGNLGAGVGRGGVWLLVVRLVVVVVWLLVVRLVVVVLIVVVRLLVHPFFPSLEDGISGGYL